MSLTFVRAIISCLCQKAFFEKIAPLFSLFEDAERTFTVVIDMTYIANRYKFRNQGQRSFVTRANFILWDTMSACGFTCFDANHIDVWGSCRYINAADKETFCFGPLQ